MNYLAADSLSKTFADKPLFKDLSFSIERGQKSGLIGINGSGKSTLLKILAGLETPDDGTVTIRNGITIGYLGQDPQFKPNNTVSEHVFGSNNRILLIIKNYEEAILNHADENKLSHAISEMDANKAWDYEQRIKQILSRLGITELTQKMGELSGGQVKRVAMAQVLIEEPDLLIMDEPTNHLDPDMIEWLENYLSTQATTIVMVTHDRYFLDNIATNIYELDNGKIFGYKGNYEYFLEKKAEREAVSDAEHEKTQNILRRELEWVRRQPKARGTKSKSRLDAYEQLKEKVSGKRKEDKLILDIKHTRLGGKILELKHLYKSFDDKKIIHNFTYTFRTGERIGVVGKNGTGKTTFLNVITGRDEADSGKINVGENTVFGYYSQEGIKLNEDLRVIEAVKEHAEIIQLSDGRKVSASQLLSHFLFPPEKQFTFIHKLSGGERRRLHLLMVLVKNPNFLILDEPTNDLDLLTLSILEDFLLNFKGCLIIVSHDRYFMDKLTEHLFVFEGDGIIKDFNGTYQEYRLIKEEVLRQAQEPPPRKAQEKIKSKSQKRKLNFNEQRELNSIEGEIEKMESRKKELMAKMSTGRGDHEELHAWSGEIKHLMEEIDHKTLRWLELQEIAENT
jgi:ABC transport system ATP-binding/permease protein